MKELIVVLLIIGAGYLLLTLMRHLMNRKGKYPCEDCPEGTYREGLYRALDGYDLPVQRAIMAELDKLPPDPRAPQVPNCPYPLETRMCRHSLDRVKDVAAAVAAGRPVVLMGEEPPTQREEPADELKGRRDDRGKKRA